MRITIKIAIPRAKTEPIVPYKMRFAWISSVRVSGVTAAKDCKVVGSPVGELVGSPVGNAVGE